MSEAVSTKYVLPMKLHGVKLDYVIPQVLPFNFPFVSKFCGSSYKIPTKKEGLKVLPAVLTPEEKRCLRR